MRKSILFVLFFSCNSIAVTLVEFVPNVRPEDFKACVELSAKIFTENPPKNDNREAFAKYLGYEFREEWQFHGHNCSHGSMNKDHENRSEMCDELREGEKKREYRESVEFIHDFVKKYLDRNNFHLANDAQEWFPQFKILILLAFKIEPQNNVLIRCEQTYRF